MWLLLRRHTGQLEVELDALSDPTYRRLGSYASHRDAIAAREEQERKDELEALRAAGQKDLFGEESR